MKDRLKTVKKTIAIYLTMVAVSTLTIALLEHVEWANAFRTAIVAALGKTLAVCVVGSFFDTTPEID